MKNSKFLALLTASLCGSLNIAISARAAQLADGTVQFDQAPALVESGATRSQTGRDGIYYFTIDLPRDAGESLAGVIISPTQSRSRQSPRSVEFDLNESEAFLGSPKQAGAALPLQQVEQLADSNDVRVTFAQPIPPGTTLTIGLKPSETPSRRYDYQFGLTAFPSAASPKPVFLGSETLSFRGERYRDYPFWWSPDDVFPFYNETDNRALFWDLPPEFDIRLRRRN